MPSRTFPGHFFRTQFNLNNLNIPIKIEPFQKSNISYKATVSSILGVFLKIKLDDADNLIKALETIEKMDSQKNRNENKLTYIIVGLLMKDQEFNDLKNYSMVCKSFYNFFTAPFSSGNGIKNLPAGPSKIVESFLAHKANIDYFEEQTKPLSGIMLQN